MKNKIWLGALIVSLAVSLFWGFSEYRQARDLKISTENQYRRSFADFVSHLDGLETNMAKSRAAGTATQQVYYLSQSWQQCETTVKDLSLLPAKDFGLGNIDQFLNQVGEFTRIVTQQIAKGQKLSTGQETTLAQMHERLISVNRDIQKLDVTLNTENISWLDKEKSGGSGGKSSNAVPAAADGSEKEQPAPRSVRSGLEQLDASLQKLPPFSYSGQTDTHYVPKPLGLPKNTVTEAEARKIAMNFLAKLGYANPDPQSSGTLGGTFSGYHFTFGTTSLDVCKQGGVVTQFNDERELQLQNLTVDQAAAQATALLKSLGWKNFVKTTTEDFGGYLQLDAVNETDGIRIYPDKIRLTVAKDNGGIISYDSSAYWLFHHQRPLVGNISQTKARSKLRKDMTVKETRQTVISLPGRQEALCYEFRGSIKDEEFLIYINALNGTEEKVQRIIRTPRGEFLQ